MKRIPLSHGQFALIDDEDYESVSRFKWHVDRHGYARTTAYMGRIGGKQKNGYMFLHQLIMRPPKGMEVDHWNHKLLDCQRVNMRVCTRLQNSQNQVRQEGTSSQFKGVRWHKGTAKWQARIALNGKNIHLGYFGNEGEAAHAYDVAAKEHFKEFAYTNF